MFRMPVQKHSGLETRSQTVPLAHERTGTPRIYHTAAVLHTVERALDRELGAVGFTACLYDPESAISELGYVFDALREAMT